MKKLLCMLLCVLLLPLSACAEESAADALTLSELTEWVSRMHQKAMNETPLNDPAADVTEGGYAFVYEFATIYADSAVMSQDTVINAVVLTAPGVAGPRGLAVDDTLNTVLEAFYTENPELSGTKEFAVIYSLEMLPESYRWAEVRRNGQRVQTVQYAVHDQRTSGGEGYTDAGVIFTMEEHFVSAIRVYGTQSRVDRAAVDAVVDNMRMHSAFNGYQQVPFSFEGGELNKFEPADLFFSNMDFLSLTPDHAMAVLGDVMADDWVEDGENGFIRTMIFSEGEVVFRYDAAKQNPSVYMLLITGDGLEGPRSVRLGDSFAAVYNRFRNGEGDLEEMTELLYGSIDGSEYGVAQYGQPYTLRYSFTLEDGTKVALQMTFDMLALTEIVLYIAD